MRTIRIAPTLAAGLLLLAVGCRASPRPSSPDWQALVDLTFGARSYEGTGPDSGDDVAAMGLEFAARPRDSVFGGEVGIAASVGGDVGEVYAGPRMTLYDAQPGIRPYLGAGVTVLRVELDQLYDVVTLPATDTTVAGYAHGGAYFEFASGVTLGLDVRGVFGTSVDSGAFSGSADYLQVGVTFGSAF